MEEILQLKGVLCHDGDGGYIYIYTQRLQREQIQHTFGNVIKKWYHIACYVKCYHNLATSNLPLKSTLASIYPDHPAIPFFPLCGVDVRIQVWMSDSQEPAENHSQLKGGPMDPTC